MPILEEYLEEIRKERVHQDTKHPEPSDGIVSPLKHLAIITEELGEFATDVNDGMWEDGRYYENMRHELIQIAASAIRAAQNLDAQFSSSDNW